MIEEFDGLFFVDGKVNGKLIVLENIVDVGGLSCVLEVVKIELDFFIEEFFVNWVMIWCIKVKKEY